MSKIRSLLAGILSAAMLLSGMPARAEIIGTEQLVTQSTRAADAARVAAFLGRADVQAQMQTLGVSADAAATRVAALTDAELGQLAARIETAPAGGDVLAVIGIAFIVLLILEQVGVINIFTSI